jgi:hypothetical protein
MTIPKKGPKLKHGVLNNSSATIFIPSRDAKPPQKDNHDMPLLPYQRLLFKSLQEHRWIWILKSRGIGVTEYLLRYIAYNCITGGFPTGSRVCIITGPRIDLAEDLISNRFKGLFLKVAPKLFDRT